jgi:hypothetical protein
MNKKLSLWILIWFIPLSVFSQHDTLTEPHSIPSSVSGYLKDLRMVVLDGKGNSQLISFLHNRFKFSHQITPNLSIKGEFRNRIFYGPGFEYQLLANQLNADDGLFDLSFIPIKDKSILMSTQIDRLSGNWNKNNLDITAGRQRINWGINLVWNPNDLFNTLNFTDFDYEERPGSDALRFQYFKGMKGLDLALSFERNMDSSVFGALYKTNYKGYDLQALASYFRGEAALGGGWAGSLKNMGFKGEFTWFSGTDSTPSLLLVSPSLDYTFGNGIFTAVSFLYRSSSSSATGSPLMNTGPAAGNLDVKSLMPNQYSAFVLASGAFSPILTGSIASIYAIDLNAAFIMPSITWSFKENMEFLILGQSYFSWSNHKIESPFHAIFVRYKWNF